VTALRRILFVEDEAPFRRFAGRYLEDRGFALTYAGGSHEALRACADELPDLVLLDLNLPDGHGLDVLRKLRARRPDQRVVVLTAYGDAATAVQALKGGATDYLTKPVRLEQLVAAVHEALGGDAAPRPPHRARAAPIPLLGSDPGWLHVLERLERVAHSEISSLLLLGESGTGKSALARQFHALAGDPDAPFVQIDCPSIPESLLESELFGHERGAFTGATDRKLGQVELGRGGTLFLDEIGELPLAIQPKLLRFLEQRRFRRVGGLNDIEANVRLVCATNRDLRGDVARGAFRTDLYYRLEGVSLELPPLRDRGDDVVEIAAALAQAFSAPDAPPPQLGDDARDALREHPFPGNVRELRNLMQRAVAFLEGATIRAADLGLGTSEERDAPAPPAPVVLERLLNAVEAHYVTEAFERGGTQRAAGALLGIDRFAVARRLNRTLREGGSETAEASLATAPPWVLRILGAHPGALPEDGIDLPALRADLEQRAIAFALRACAGNRARASALLGMSRTSLHRRLD